MNNHDVIVIGAGSVGVPITYFLAKAGAKVLCVESGPAPGQGQNKAAIGGVRATHSDPAKIKICQKSLEIFSQWQGNTGGDIGWKKGGYCFPVYRPREEKILKELLPIQKQHHLNIDWVDAEAVANLIPGINRNGLIGGTYSPDDGQVSPLKAINSITREAQKSGAEFYYNTTAVAFDYDHGRLTAVQTDRGRFAAGAIVNAAGARASELCQQLGLDIPVQPDSHEAGITAPVEHFLDPLVVDLRPGPEGKTANFYFGQNSEGQLIFCYTPSPIFPGDNRESTSEFMPIIARRMIELVPRFKNLMVRRIWRGLYPMTPDGSAIIGKAPNFSNFYLAVGMCGQGFMMGPGVGANVAALIVNGKALIPEAVMALLSPSRDFYAKKELLK